MTSEGATDPPPSNSRRNFLKQAGATVAAVAFVGIGVPGVLKDPHFPSMAESSGAILVDPTLCICLLYTSPSPRDGLLSRMPSSA